MPSAISRHAFPDPQEVRSYKATSPPRIVRFDSDALVTGITRPLISSEAMAIYNFEEHAQRCSSCYRPYEVYRNGGQLCERGHSLAQSVASQLYKDRGGIVYSTAKEDHRLINVEIPRGFEHGLQLLRAIERSLRHRRRKPFVSLDRTYYVPPRIAPIPSARSHGFVSPPQYDTYESFPEYEEHWPHYHHHHRKHYHVSPRANIVEWPDYEDPPLSTSHVSSDFSDLSWSTKNHYKVEVIEPTHKELRQRDFRQSRYW